MSKIHGIHHITAIASEPQQCVDFYTWVLGLRLVKKTVNQDDVSAYHLFFGDTTGEPGMDLTFFTFQPVIQGRRGPGQVTEISLAVREDALLFWQERFEKENVKQEEIEQRFGEKRLRFYDPDDQRLALVGVSNETYEAGVGEVWETEEIHIKKAIGYFHSAQMAVASEDLIRPVLTRLFGYELVDDNEQLQLYRLPSEPRANFLEVAERPLMERGVNAAGTVHHIAFQVESEADQLALREQVLLLGLHPTAVIDRYYFKSVYFRTPAGILFEIATSGPGFTVDEDEKQLGERLVLPPFLEGRREEIEEGLEPI